MSRFNSFLSYILTTITWNLILLMSVFLYKGYNGEGFNLAILKVSFIFLLIIVFILVTFSIRKLKFSNSGSRLGILMLLCSLIIWSIYSTSGIFSISDGPNGGIGSPVYWFLENLFFKYSFLFINPINYTFFFLGLILLFFNSQKKSFK